MSLEDLIAAERTRPSEPTAVEAKSLWKRIRGGAGVVVPPMFDVSPASTVVTLQTKLSAVLSTVVGKAVVATAVAGTLAGGTAAVVTAVEEPAVVVKADRGGAAKQVAPTKEPVRAAVPAEPVPAEPVPEEPAIEILPDEPAPAVQALPPPEPAVAPKRRAKPAEPSTFGGEFTLIKQAQRDLGGGRADAALAVLAEHVRRFPKGSMTEDRLALRALALCKAGRHDEGRRAAKLLERRFPRSLYAERVGRDCS
jgi:hypothetical protein